MMTFLLWDSVVPSDFTVAYTLNKQQYWRVRAFSEKAQKSKVGSGWISLANLEYLSSGKLLNQINSTKQQRHLETTLSPKEKSL